MAVSVTFGNGLGTNVNVVSDTELTVVTPAHAPGVVDVAVSTAGGTATVADAFTYAAPPVLDITVPSPIAVTVGEATTYTTSLTNTGGAADTVTEEIRFHSTDGPLTEDMIVYETDDNGTWVTADFTVDGGDLVFTETFPVPAGLDADSDVRITVDTDLDNLTGTSTIRSAGGTVLATATYEYTVTAPAPTPPTITSIVPDEIPEAGAAGVRVTGTGLSTTTTQPQVLVDGVAVNASTNGDTSATFTAPAGTGSVDIAYRTSNGTSEPLVDGLTYRPAPTITSITPDPAAADATDLVIIGTGFDEQVSGVESLGTWISVDGDGPTGTTGLTYVSSTELHLDLSTRTVTPGEDVDVVATTRFNGGGATVMSISSAPYSLTIEA